MAGVSLMEGHQNGREVEETQLAVHRIEPVVEASTKRKIRELRIGRYFRQNYFCQNGRNRQDAQNCLGYGEPQDAVFVLKT